MHRRRMLPLTVVLVAGVALVACSDKSQNGGIPTPSKPFCEAAYQYDNKVATLSTDAQIKLVEKMDAHAPTKIRADVDTFLSSLRKVKAGDRSVVDNKSVQAAVQRVEHYASNGCQFFQRDPAQGI